jgi:single-strand DNA-binding protein
VSLAKVVLSGTIASDPEKRFTSNQNVAVTNFNLAVQPPIRPGSDRPEEPFLIRVTCWRNLAEVAAEQLQKGEAIVVEGKLQINAYQTPEGVAKKSFEVDAASIDKVSGVPTPLVVSAQQGAASSAPRQNNMGGGGNNAYASSQPMAAGGGYAAGGGAAVATATAPQATEFSAEDLLTEDDIPF